MGGAGSLVPTGQLMQDHVILAVFLILLTGNFVYLIRTAGILPAYVPVQGPDTNVINQKTTLAPPKKISKSMSFPKKERK